MSTTLAIVISTTLICGGLTEPMLTRMGMRTDKNDADTEQSLSPAEKGSARSGLSSGHSSTLSGLHGQHGMHDDNDAPCARTATSSNFIEMLSGVTNRSPYEVFANPNPTLRTRRYH